MHDKVKKNILTAERLKKFNLMKENNGTVVLIT